MNLAVSPLSCGNTNWRQRIASTLSKSCYSHSCQVVHGPTLPSTQFWEQDGFSWPNRKQHHQKIAEILEEHWDVRLSLQLIVKFILHLGKYY